MLFDRVLSTCIPSGQLFNASDVYHRNNNMQQESNEQDTVDGQQKTDYRTGCIVIGCVAIVVLYLAFGYAAQILCNAIGVAYPAYISMKAIETRTKEDDTRWLTYWVIYGVLSVFEHFSFFLVQIIPFYWLLKCIFFVWCMVPIENNGSTVMYNKVILPYFRKYEKSADNLIGQATDKIKQVAGDVISKKLS
ncbi:receptor expression-enhancing protein 5 isoform X2 [Toxorhynchites rutilus septentrionalis]|uniref:receptor expression-enhancing protein 5 isoform X2 n=1 Tax=Toxorhynchites rutilus septentrionalis TaxID=329112 RepID=UPI00247A8FD3|nr:receptor expression-enhancing protein 5 isoform X2 [Toxorhynchites rutilus septentrionalis]